MTAKIGRHGGEGRAAGCITRSGQGVPPWHERQVVWLPLLKCAFVLNFAVCAGSDCALARAQPFVSFDVLFFVLQFRTTSPLPLLFISNH
jgi:hypothetical protein